MGFLSIDQASGSSEGSSGKKPGVQIAWVATGSTQAGIITLDVSLSERHSLDSEITEHPVEQGVNPVDHTRPRPASLSIESVVTDYPLSIRGGGIGDPAAKGRATGIFNKLDQLRIDGTICKVTTGVRAYSNMLIKSIDMPRDKQLKGAVHLSLTFTEIRIVASQSVPVQTAATSAAQPKANNGQQNGQNANTGVQNKSVAASIADGQAPELFKQLGASVFGG